MRAGGGKTGNREATRQPCCCTRFRPCNFRTSFPLGTPTLSLLLFSLLGRRRFSPATQGNEGLRTGTTRVGHSSLLTNARMLRNYEQVPLPGGEVAPGITSSSCKQACIANSCTSSHAAYARMRVRSDRLEAAPVIVQSDVSSWEADGSSSWALTMGLDGRRLRSHASGESCTRRILDGGSRSWAAT